MISVKQVSKSFGERRVLNQITMQVAPGECVFVLGKSGVGKSVLLKLMVGLNSPESGEIHVAGLKVEAENSQTLAQIRKKCGLVFQFPALLDSVSVFENISFGIRAREISVNPSEIEAKVREKLSLVGLNEKVLGKFPTELSFSTQKRVSIARTLAVEPDYLLFDEPTTGMDPIATTGLNHLIKKLSQELKVTTVVVSHDIKSAFAVGDRIILLDQGQIVFEGSAEKFKTSTASLAKQFQEEMF
ncbi:MAG: ABC transporter ATP-binding protein [Deltaproteobacteria bacterium]